MKTTQIQIPDGYELEQVSKGKWELVKSKKYLHEILDEDNVSFLSTGLYFDDLDLRQRSNWFIALSKLKCVANYLNNGWQPNWNDNEEKWHIEWYEYGVNKLRVDLSCTHSTCGEVVFKTQELAEKAIEICGEDLIKMALGV